MKYLSGAEYHEHFRLLTNDACPVKEQRHCAEVPSPSAQNETKQFIQIPQVVCTGGRWDSHVTKSKSRADTRRAPVVPARSSTRTFSATRRTTAIRHDFSWIGPIDPVLEVQVKNLALTDNTAIVQRESARTSESKGVESGAVWRSESSCSYVHCNCPATKGVETLLQVPVRLLMGRDLFCRKADRTDLLHQIFCFVKLT